MKISKDELEKIKEELSSYINDNFPKEKREELIKKLASMNDDELLEFLNKNSIIKDEECILCSIALKKIHSCILKENNENIAVLDINPLSYGSSLIIPKKHGEIGEDTLMLAEEIKSMIEQNLSPQEVRINKLRISGHEMINLIPIYEDKTLKKENKSIEELELLKRKILSPLEKNQEELKSLEEKSSKEKEEKLWIPRRIP